MNRYCHFTTIEREKLLIYKISGKSLRAISSVLGKSPSAICRELKRNTNGENPYSPSEAERLYRVRRLRCRRKRRLDKEKELCDIVHHALVELYWSPEQIANRLRCEDSGKIIGTSTIYRAIYNGPLRKSMTGCLRIKSKTLGKSKGPHRKGFIHQTICDRPEAAEKRSECGHFECDTVIASRGQGYIFTNVDRKSRLLVAAISHAKDSDAFNKCSYEAFARAGIQPKTFTCDRGSEFAGHDTLKKLLKVDVYFAHPYSPWERGTNENTNGLLRQFFPKLSSFYDLTKENLNEVVWLLNLRPRKCLGWMTPFEVFYDKVLHLT